ncbi:hypothetical protein [Paralcaligenes ureilyticus]|uniref:Glucosyltransferase GtrII-like protein n=1 Tax=Paralcaligenes ureilyticus TaxID=627131 RepID=A0A4R3MC73_9BURK|nr:hypothetical protein [Paralcaligenes ureilyticus]TCT09065.1 hypothetical protein EDC26_104225 [Paralcaligenes ureilyticus]
MNWPNNRMSYIRTVPLAIVCALLCATISVVLWEANRGLAILGDEGTYFLAARYPSEIQQNVSAVFSFTGAMFRLVDYDPALFRALGVVLVLFSSFVFYIGFLKIVTALYPTAINIKFLKFYSLFFIATGGILHYQWSYLTPSYYTLTAITLNLFCGLVLLGLVYLEEKKLTLAYLVSVAAGFVFGYTLFFKFTTAMPLFFMAMILSLLWNRVDFPLRRRFLIAMLLGFLFWLAFYFIFEQAPVQTFEMFKEGWRLYQTLTLLYDPVKRLLAYLVDLWVLLYTAIFYYWPCYLILVSGVLIKYRYREFKDPAKLYTFSFSFSLLLTWLVVIVALVVSWHDGVFVDVSDRLKSFPINGRTLSYLGFELGWLLLLGAVYVFNSPQRKSKGNNFTHTGLLCLFLFLAPIAGSLGTSNPLYNVISFYAVPWFGVIYLLLILLTLHYGKSSALLVFVVVTMCAYISSQVIQGSVYQPAQIKPRTLFEQSIATSVGDPPFTLMLDRETHNVIQQLSLAARANGFVPGGDIIGFDRVAGLVYAMGGRSPGHPVFPCCFSASYNKYSEIALKFSDLARLKKAFILLDVKPGDPIPAILASAGIHFPDDYRLVGRVQGVGHVFLLYRPVKM